MAKRVYTREETEAILSRALELQGRGDATSHDDLLAAGREVGIRADTIERAAAELLTKGQDESRLREIRARYWHGFYAHLVPYVLVNALLAFINSMTGGPPWMLIVTLGWGVGLASHLLAVANPDPRSLRRRLERERRYAARTAPTGPEAVRVASVDEPVRVRADVRDAHDGADASGLEDDALEIGRGRAKS
jgi:hypothetical protein